MIRMVFGATALVISLVSFSQSHAADCTRASLQSLVDKYVAAQETGDASGLPLAASFKYIENAKPGDIKTGILSHKEKVDYNKHNLLDTTACKTYSELIITDPAHPYVIGTQMSVTKGKIAEINSLVSDDGDWLFSAKGTLKYASAEDWKPEALDRKSLLKIANTYFDRFDNPKIKVPWGPPCDRLEGGVYTGKGKPDDTCDLGVPNNVKITNRIYVVDEALGAVDIMADFGPNKQPDSHMFKIDGGQIRFVHTITICTIPRCGFGPAPANAPKPEP